MMFREKFFKLFTLLSFPAQNYRNICCKASPTLVLRKNCVDSPYIHLYSFSLKMRFHNRSGWLLSEVCSSKSVFINTNLISLNANSTDFTYYFSREYGEKFLSTFCLKIFIYQMVVTNVVLHWTNSILKLIQFSKLLQKSWPNMDTRCQLKPH